MRIFKNCDNTLDVTKEWDFLVNYNTSEENYDPRN
jgi:hypothetical protein